MVVEILLKFFQLSSMLLAFFFVSICHLRNQFLFSKKNCYYHHHYHFVAFFLGETEKKIKFPLQFKTKQQQVQLTNQPTNQSINQLIDFRCQNRKKNLFINDDNLLTKNKKINEIHPHSNTPNIHHTANELGKKNVSKEIEFN